MKKGAVKVMDQGIGEAPEADFADTGEQVSGEDRQEPGMAAVDDAALENRVIDPEALNRNCRMKGRPFQGRRQLLLPRREQGPGGRRSCPRATPSKRGYGSASFSP